MATNKNRWLVDAIGTMRDFWRIGSAGVRLKNVSGVLQVRNSGDTADAGLKVSALQMPTGAGANKVATSDATGNMSWQNGAIPVSGSYPETFMFFGDEMRVNAGSFINFVNTSIRYNGGRTVTDINAACFKTIHVQAGTWTIFVLTIKNNNLGIHRCIMDGNLMGDIDLYAAALQADYLHTFTGVVVTGDGSHSLSINMNGKNAASSGHGYFINKVWGYRTGS